MRVINKHKDNTRVSAETARHESTCIIVFLTRHNESIKTTIFTHRPVSHSLGLRSAADFTIDC